MMVSAGLTAPLEGKKLPSTTYRLSDVVRLAVGVERRRLRVPAEPDGPVLMRDAGERNAIAHEQVPRHQMRVHVEVLEEVLQLLDQIACGPRRCSASTTARCCRGDRA